jgi:ribose-phosphate pyrophosphokinase
MKYLNLTEGFNPYGAPECDFIHFESFFFNGGEPHIKLNPDSFPDEGSGYWGVTITSRLTSMNEFMMLIIATEALQQTGFVKNMYLFIPYFPGARQDRRMVDGEPLTVKVFAEIINDFNFDSVTTYDNHSDVSTALIDNCDNLDNEELVSNCIIKDNLSNYVFISPDSGANKKSKDLVTKFNNIFDPDNPIDLIKCDKTRNVVTGEITGFEVYSNNFNGKNCVIVDDIADGAGTFIGLAKELKNKGAGDIYLIVSHGIFSKPLKDLKPYFKKIYTTDSWRSEFSVERQKRDCTELVEIIPFNTLL